MLCSHCHTDLSTTEGYVELIKDMNDALNFLECHPALGGACFDLHSNLWYSVQEVCKRGFCRLHDGEIDIHYTPENYKRYKELFDEEMKELPEIEKKLARVSIPYETHFGEPWTFDHVEYWGELGFKMFIGNDFNKYFDRDKWGGYCGIETSGRSFEELIINVSKKFKEAFGDFSEDDFLTKKEKDNHKKEWPFVFIPVEDKKHPGCSEMKHNKKHIDVNSSEINRRWVKWFVKTPYGKKHWKENCEKILAGKQDC
jgi:hypothetical protein